MKYKEYIYLDHAATTPLDPLVKRVILPYLNDKFGNPGSLHEIGREAITAVDKSRKKIAGILNTDFHNIIFTGSATEANNLAVKGVIEKAFEKQIKNPKIIISAIEHPSVLNTVKFLEGKGIDVSLIGVDKNGFINVDKIKKELDKNTVLVSVMYANNEIGTIQPITKISRIIKDFRKLNNESPDSGNIFPLFHTDAVQAFQYCPSDIEKLGVDLLTLSAHKIYGPKGIGLLVDKKINFNEYSTLPIITGGGQEFGLRSGTENVAFMVGFAKTIELVIQRKTEELKRMKKLGIYFYKKLKEIYSKIEINGVPFDVRESDDSVLKTLPNIYNIYFPDYKAEELLMKFDINGIAISAGSACSARSIKLSPTIQALNYSKERAGSSIRFSFGKNTNKKEIDQVIERITKIIVKNH